MKLLNFFKWLLPKSKRQRMDEILLRHYNEGRVLRVDDGTDNKKYLLDLEKKNEKD